MAGGYLAGMKRLMLAVILGAGLMWFYDPANGVQRREALQRTLGRMSSRPFESQPPLTAEDAARADVPLYAAQ